MDDFLTRKEHEEYCKRIDQENSRQNRRLDRLEQHVEQIGALAGSVEKLAMSMKTMAEEQGKQGKRLETLESRDGEMWRKAVGYAVTVVIGAVLGYFLTHVGM